VNLREVNQRENSEKARISESELILFFKVFRISNDPQPLDLENV
jgi:hypothetical protein